MILLKSFKFIHSLLSLDSDVSILGSFKKNNKIKQINPPIETIITGMNHGKNPTKKPAKMKAKPIPKT